MSMRPRNRNERPFRSNPEQEYTANSWIRSPNVRLIDENGKSEVIDTRKAIEQAQTQGLDLITISHDADPPVCRIYDLSKYAYEQKKIKKEQDRKNRENAVVTKEIQLRPGIGEHDLLIKQRHANEFLEEGNKVKVVMKFRGREMAHKDMGFAVIHKFLEGMVEHRAEKEPSLAGNMIMVMLAPTKSKN